MQVIIDIPSHIYKTLIETGTYGYYKFDSKNAIKNGIPLPKGHGAIKDVSQIEIPMCEDRAYERWVQVAIDSAPTIIEASKGQEND